MEPPGLAALIFGKIFPCRDKRVFAKVRLWLLVNIHDAKNSAGKQAHFPFFYPVCA